MAELLLVLLGGLEQLGINAALVRRLVQSLVGRAPVSWPLSGSACAGALSHQHLHLQLAGCPLARAAAGETCWACMRQSVASSVLASSSQVCRPQATQLPGKRAAILQLCSSFTGLRWRAGTGSCAAGGADVACQAGRRIGHGCRPGRDAAVGCLPPLAHGCAPFAACL